MHVSNRCGSRVAVFIGGLIICASLLICITTKQPVAFFIFYAGGFGIGKGFIYPAPLRATWSHLPGRKGIVSGVIVSGLGLGAFLYGIIIQQIVNPNNLPTEEYVLESGVVGYGFSSEVTDRVPMMLGALAAMFAAQVIIGIIMISDFKKVEAEVNEDDWEDVERVRLEKLAKKAPVMKLVFSWEFLELYILTLMQIFYGYFIMNSFKTYGAATIKNDAFLTVIGSVGALVNGVMRIFWSSLLDYFPFRRVNGILLVI